MTTQIPSAQTAIRKAPVFRINTRDQMSALLVVIVTLVAILAGLVWRNVVEARTKSYAAPSGVTIEYPEPWRLDATNADAGLVRVSDALATEYLTTFEVRWLPVTADAGDEEALATAVNTLALNRGRDLSSFKLLDVQAGQTIKTLPGATVSFVFVYDPTSLFQEGIPAVVLGDDLLVRKGERVYVFSLLAARENRDLAEQRFQAFVESARLP
ncbi:MAG: hypothetical protein ACUVR3_08125 [Candidatus Roseilinea sp.]|uniref:hypothetical protein n=1 Tax=Candidatus Roseilinea sp. TaxID=2838777 RepID=UPI00404A1F0C